MSGCLGCLCTAAVEYSYSLWGLLKAAAVSMSKPLVVSKILQIPQTLPLPDRGGSKAVVIYIPAIIVSVVCPWLCALMERAQQGCAPACPAWSKCHWELRALTSWGISTPFPDRIWYFIYSEKICVLQEQRWILSQQFLLNQNFMAFVLFR